MLKYIESTEMYWDHADNAFRPPDLNNQIALVLSESEVSLSAIICSCATDPGMYTPVFTFPQTSLPYTGTFSPKDDGFIFRLRLANKAIFINNALVMLQTKKVFFVGFDDTQFSYFRRHLPPRMVIRINSVADIERQFADAIGKLSAPVRCKKTQLVEGLLLATRQKKFLVVDDSAADIRDPELQRRGGLIVLENKGSTDELVALCYASSLNADVVLVPPYEREALRSAQKAIYQAKQDGSTQQYFQLRSEVRKRCKKIRLHHYDYCTFFTRGFPYGLFFKNVIPISHVFSSIEPDLFLVNNLLYEHVEMDVGRGIVFSPQLFNDEETKDVIKALEQNNYLVEALLGKAATVDALENQASHTPYDILHICSHGGETDGYFVISKFRDRTGAEHSLEYEEVIGISPGMSSSNVRLTRKLIFRKIDGVVWSNNESANLPSYVYEDMVKHIDDKNSSRTEIRVKADYPIESSFHIKCHDSIHQGTLHVLAAHRSPLVFNNTCSSWSDIATLFIHAGARGYVGTLWRVGSATATNAANVFYEELFATQNVLLAFTAMVKSIRSDKYKNIYLFWGLHFSGFEKQNEKSNERFHAALLTAFAQAFRKFRETADETSRNNQRRVLKFLAEEIPRHLQVPSNTSLATAIREGLALPTSEKTDLERGVLDV